MRGDYRFLRAHGASVFRAARIAIARAVLARWCQDARKNSERRKDLEEQDRIISHANTRDNYVRHAITTGECPICKRPLDISIGRFERTAHRLRILIRSKRPQLRCWMSIRAE
jgi:hypothetical protein